VGEPAFPYIVVSNPAGLHSFSQTSPDSCSLGVTSWAFCESPFDLENEQAFNWFLKQSIPKTFRVYNVLRRAFVSSAQLCEETSGAMSKNSASRVSGSFGDILRGKKQPVEPFLAFFRRWFVAYPYWLCYYLSS
jgi:hypothetical protein